MKKGFTLIELMVVIGVIALLSSIALPRFSDSTSAGKAAQVHGNLQNIQQAIEMFHVKEGDYPVYGTDIGSGDGSGLSDKLAKYYSKSKMPETPAGGSGISDDEIIRSKVFDVFDEKELKGGWLYNKDEGKLFARLEEDTYGQGNIWVTAYDIDGWIPSKKSYPGMTLVNDEARWFSMDTFDKFTMETSLTIGGAGRMEIFLEGLNEDGVMEGYRLRIHPVMEKILLVSGEKPETIVSSTDLNALGIDKKTWFSGGNANEVPIKLDISNGDIGSKSLSLEIDGVKVLDSMNYTPSEGSSEIGLGNKLDSKRELVVGDISVESK